MESTVEDLDFFWGLFVRAAFTITKRAMPSLIESKGESKAPCTLDATRDATRKNGTRSHFVAFCIMRCCSCLQCEQSCCYNRIYGVLITSHLVCMGLKDTRTLLRLHPHQIRRKKRSKLGRAAPCCNNSSVHIARTKQRITQQVSEWDLAPHVAYCYQCGWGLSGRLHPGAWESRVTDQRVFQNDAFSQYLGYFCQLLGWQQPDVHLWACSENLRFSSLSLSKTFLCHPVKYQLPTEQPDTTRVSDPDTLGIESLVFHSPTHAVNCQVIDHGIKV